MDNIQQNKMRVCILDDMRVKLLVDDLKQHGAVILFKVLHDFIPARGAGFAYILLEQMLEMVSIVAADAALGAKAQIIVVFIVGEQTEIAVLFEIALHRELEVCFEIVKIAVRVVVHAGKLVDAEELFIAAGCDLIFLGVNKETAGKSRNIVPVVTTESSAGKVESRYRAKLFFVDIAVAAQIRYEQLNGCFRFDGPIGFIRLTIDIILDLIGNKACGIERYSPQMTAELNMSLQRDIAGILGQDIIFLDVAMTSRLIDTRVAP